MEQPVVVCLLRNIKSWADNTHANLPPGKVDTRKRMWLPNWSNKTGLSSALPCGGRCAYWAAVRISCIAGAFARFLRDGPILCTNLIFQIEGRSRARSSFVCFTERFACHSRERTKGNLYPACRPWHFAKRG
jgi:hypothetical protein